MPISVHSNCKLRTTTLEQREKASVVDLCVLPVSKWLYWGDPADIELEQIKRAMQTWTDYHYKLTQRSYERMRREIVQLLLSGLYGYICVLKRVMNLPRWSA